jgi:hypothetical protein
MSLQQDTICRLLSQVSGLPAAAFSGVAAVVEALDTTFVSGVLSNIGANLSRAGTELWVLAGIFGMFLVSRLMEDRRRLSELGRLTRAGVLPPLSRQFNRSH